VQLTLEPGVSVAEVARAHGVNANQVFKWRRAFERGELVEPCALLPVSVSAPGDLMCETPHSSAEEQATRSGAIHIELPGRVMQSAHRAIQVNWCSRQVAEKPLGLIGNASETKL